VWILGHSSRPRRISSSASEAWAPSVSCSSRLGESGIRLVRVKAGSLMDRGTERQAQSESPPLARGWPTSSGPSGANPSAFNVGRAMGHSRSTLVDQERNMSSNCRFESVGIQFDSLPAGAFGPNQMSTEPSAFCWSSAPLDARLARLTPLVNACVCRS